MREDIETRSLRTSKGSSKGTRKSPKRSNKDISLNTTSKRTGSVKAKPRRPHNIDYLQRLAQPKSTGKYVLVKEDSSESADEDSKLNERQKQLK